MRDRVESFPRVVGSGSGVRFGSGAASGVRVRERRGVGPPVLAPHRRADAAPLPKRFAGSGFAIRPIARRATAGYTLPILPFFALSSSEDDMGPFNRREFLQNSAAVALAALRAPPGPRRSVRAAEAPHRPERGAARGRRRRQRPGHEPRRRLQRQERLRDRRHLRLRRGGRRAGHERRRGERREGAGLRQGHPQDHGRQVDRHRLDRHAEPLARPGRHLGHAGRQGRVRREAGQPQRQRGPADGRGGPPLQRDLPGRHPEPLATPASAGPSSTSTPARSARSSWPTRRATSSAARSGTPASRPASRSRRGPWTTTCGAARPRSRSRAARPRTAPSTTTGTGPGTTATATSATRASTRWTRPAGA